MKMTVIGMGYLGLTHAAAMAELGHDILGLDIDTHRIDALNSGSVPFHEPGLPDVLTRVRNKGRLRFSASYEDAAAFADVHFIAVGTPQRRGEYAADLTYVEDVIDNLVPHMTSDAVILGKSTVPVGTTDALMARAAAIAPHGITVTVAWNPEFLREGHAVNDTLHPDRIVLGTTDPAVESLTAQIYANAIDAGTPYLVMSPQSAELVKVSANAFLATKISFINAVAQVCDAADADVDQVATAIGIDDRIGGKFLKAGIGFGGGCLPKDIRAYAARAGELGATDIFSLLREVDRINNGRRTRMLSVVQRAIGHDLLGTRVAVLGCAFKPDSDDVRDSPALNIAGQLQLQGAIVTIYDPRGADNARRVFPTLDTACSAEEACAGADVVMVLTEWPEFADLDPVGLAALTRRQILIDGRHTMPAELWRKAGWHYLT
ncbi:UDP-glucose dehydrogenase family protein [Mycolicibacterium fortuitum]|uniref:UDP-glucose dehydrogenase family protein n=1 Tax=Mycolicibacterium fortuitum TaxID=1766 RepID=UPI002607B8D6|nr:UDP-glucose/GDP-mannose dehydrogenase family protein [Mycolicibacterium fortuitum]